jgi:hypothetical protein
MMEVDDLVKRLNVELNDEDLSNVVQAICVILGNIGEITEMDFDSLMRMVSNKVTYEYILRRLPVEEMPSMVMVKH